jgi:two-component system LytT family response regulator
MIRTLIVDDEPLSRQRVRDLLLEDAEISIVGECGDGAAALSALRSSGIDLVFLDVQMPGLDGLGVIKSLGSDRMPAVIFITAHDCYALPAFEVHAVDYLLKPFDRERFNKALAWAKAHLARDRGGPFGQQLLAQLAELKATPRPLERVMVKSGGKIYFVKTDDIDWVEAASNYLKLHVGREFHLLRETMNSLEGRLDPSLFVRIHRSTLVNVERIKELQPLFHGDYAVLLHDGTQLTLSRTYREGLPKILGQQL